MRVYLNCPFDEKDEAKALGARWDPQKKRWYIQDVKDLSAFARWLPDEGDAPSTAPAASRPARTGPAEPPPHCGCAVLPWEPCVHTPAARP